MRYKLVIEYAGSKYSGWQVQQNARTVQGELNRAVAVAVGRPADVQGSGRTDAGVHALGQVAHVDVPAGVPPELLRRRINDELPADINVLTAEQVPHRFHARHHAIARRYLYQIARRRTAFAKPFVWWVKEPMDNARTRAAAAAFTGMRDFDSFAARDDRRATPSAARGSRAPRDDDEGDERSTRVLVDRLDIIEDGDLILVAIEGSHFLWKMVRRIVGVLAAIGRGDMAAAEAARLLTGPTDLPARLTAPASGLFLERVYYRGDSRGTPLRPITPLPSAVPSTRRTTA
jgi:tRNA pseudouridine38-40 synthase